MCFGLLKAIQASASLEVQFQGTSLLIWVLLETHAMYKLVMPGPRFYGIRASEFPGLPLSLVPQMGLVRW